MGGLGVKVQHFPLTLLVVLTTLTLPCERDFMKTLNTSLCAYTATFPSPLPMTHRVTVYDIFMTSFCLGLLQKYTHHAESLSELLNAIRNLTS